MSHLHAQATLNANAILPPPPPLGHPVAAYEQLLSLASLAQALDKSLPARIRFVQFAHSDADGHAVGPVRVLFSNQIGSIMDNGWQDTKAVELWDALERVLPAQMVQMERDNIQSLPRANFADHAGVAWYGAVREGLVSVETKTLDDGRTVRASEPISPGALTFMNNPAHARWVYLSPGIQDDDGIDAAREPSIRAFRHDVQGLRDILSRPFSEASGHQRQFAADAVGRLSARKVDFEQRHDHGWIGYAAAHKAAGWAGFLVKAGASPHQAYNGISPLVWAAASNDRATAQAVLDAGASPSVIFSSTPEVFEPPHQQRLRNVSGNFTNPLRLSCAMGATAVAATMIGFGADPNAANERGETALHIAARLGNEELVRLLIKSGASLEAVDNDGAIPAQRVPESADSLFNTMEDVRLGVSAAPAPGAVEPELASRLETRRDEFGEQPSKWATIDPPNRPRKDRPR